MSDEQKPVRYFGRVERWLENSDFTEDEKNTWLVRLQSSGLEESEVLDVLEGLSKEQPFSATRSFLSYQWTVWKHKFRRWWHHGSPTWRVLYAIGWLTLLVTPVLKENMSPKILAVAIVIVISKFRFVVTDVEPKNMRFLKIGYEERKLLFRKLLEQQQLWADTPPTPRELRHFQEEALRLVANYVRNHRSDLSTTKVIFTNLIIRENDGVTVIARSDVGRQVPVHCTGDQCTLTWKTFQTGKPQFTGDLYASSPTTAPNKQYHSVLTLPVWRNNQLVGVVSIDSEEKHHFDGHFDELVVALGPYIQLFAQTLHSNYSHTNEEEADD